MRLLQQNGDPMLRPPDFPRALQQPRHFRIRCLNAQHRSTNARRGLQVVQYECSPAVIQHGRVRRYCARYVIRHVLLLQHLRLRAQAIQEARLPHRLRVVLQSRKFVEQDHRLLATDLRELNRFLQVHCAMQRHRFRVKPSHRNP